MRFAVDRDTKLTAVDDVSFDVHPGRRFAIVGESGSGKSVTALSILGLVDPPGQIEAGQILFRGQNLSSLSSKQLRRIRGREIGFVMQDPLASLSPVFSVGEQIVETIRCHENVGRRVATARAVELLKSVGIPDAERRTRDYPHQFSGGMRQRVAMAIAVACNPSLLIADEPTTALDVTIQAQVLELLGRLSREEGTAIVLITHDLGVVAGFADEVAIMYAGRIVERGTVDAIYARPQHPYTVALLASQPRRRKARTGRMTPILGQPPSPLHRPTGCSFHPRCQLTQGREVCVTNDPPARQVAERHWSACHFAEELDRQRGVRAVGQ